MMDTCFLCNVRQDRTRVRWQSNLLYLIFDSHPVSPGHALLIPKRHVEDFIELNESEWKEYRNGIREAISVIESTDLTLIYQQFITEHITAESVWFSKKALNNPRLLTKPDAYNHGFNDGSVAGRTVNHFHWHIIPRHRDDMNDPRGGIRYVIPDMGNYKIARK